MMNEAYQEALISEKENEVPIGCVIVKDGVIIGRGHNTRQRKNSIVGHAEINALNDAAQNVGSWKLDGAELYVTMEPCLMCYGAIIQSRIEKIYVGCKQLMYKKNSYRYYVKEEILEVDYSYCDDKYSSLVSNFFEKQRKEKND